MLKKIRYVKNVEVFQQLKKEPEEALTDFNAKIVNLGYPLTINKNSEMSSVII